MDKNIEKSDKSYYEQLKSRDKILGLDESDINNLNSNFWKTFSKYQMLNAPTLNFGDFFVYQIVDKNVISYPKLAIFVKYMMVDMALELQFIDKPRTWMDNIEFLSNPELNIKMPLSQRETEFSYHIDWHENMFIFGNWSHQPNWKEIRQAYERSIWFYKDQNWYRDQQLKRLL